MTTGTDDGRADPFADPLFSTLVAELESIADGPAPAVGGELAAVLSGAGPVAHERRRNRARSVVVIGLLAGGVLSGGVGAAAADELPAPVQRVVARVVNTLTPFEIPHPDRAPTRRDPTPTPPVEPSPVVPTGGDDGTDDSPDDTSSTVPEPGDDSAEDRGEDGGEDRGEDRERDRSDDAAATTVDADGHDPADEDTDRPSGDDDERTGDASTDDGGERDEAEDGSGDGRSVTSDGGGEEDGAGDDGDGEDDGSGSGED